MNTSIEHLPKKKQEELFKIISIVREHARVEMIILFGSHARGTWVDDRYVDPQDGITYEYKSDYDILLVVRSKIAANSTGLWNKIENLIRKNTEIGTLVSIIVHDIGELNEKLRTGEYFFNDIVRDGVLLFNSEKFQLESTLQLNSQERARIAKQDYDYWFVSADEFFTYARIAISNGHLKKAAFFLNQCIEHNFVCILLVFTHYKPKLHNLEKLYKLVSEFDHRFASVFPQKTDEERKLFALINSAYIHARYTKTYVITEDNLMYLYSRVEKLKGLTQDACLNQIKQMAAPKDEPVVE
jgi:HEPN domain-containing protein/predicted nucleotidyltransferase